MAYTKEFFLTIAQRIFSNWTALKLVVEHGIGPKENAVEFCSYITEVLYMNEGLSSSEIAVELEDYMDDQFNTELQDNSSTQVAEELLRFYRYCVEGNEFKARTELEKLPPLQLWLVSAVSNQSNNRSFTTNCDSSSDEDMNKDRNTVNEEWTEVRSRRNK